MNKINKLHAFLYEKQLDGLIIVNPLNLRYFTGFTGSTAVAYISKDLAHIVTDSRYTEQAKAQCQGFEVHRYEVSPWETLNKIVLAEHENLAFEGNHMVYSAYEKMTAALKGKSFTSTELEILRSVKTEEELVLLKKAAVIADEAFKAMLPKIAVGMTENEVRVILETEMLKLGSQKPSFDTIVASGERSSLPHGRASEKRIESGDFVTFDFGATYQGFHSDTTRTIVMGTASDEQRQIYDLVLEAQCAGVKAVKAGIMAKEVDTISRDIIKKAGYGEFFGHGLGHGVGLDIHEQPVLSPLSEAILEENMVVTVEPGVYLPKRMGVRIEDTVIVTKDGCEVITHLPKELIEIK